MCSIDNPVKEYPLSPRRHIKFLHDPNQLISRLEPFDLVLEILDRVELLFVMAAGFIAYLFELLQVAKQVVVDYLAYLLVLGGIVYELLFIFLYQFF